MNEGLVEIFISDIGVANAHTERIDYMALGSGKILEYRKPRGRLVRLLLENRTRSFHPKEGGMGPLLRSGKQWGASFIRMPS